MAGTLIYDKKGWTMHPNEFLKTFWRLELKPEIFVAMSFADQYKPRFDQVIAPAIRDIVVNGKALEPKRVDLSKSGDSILTQIVDGIAHSQMVLADVSTIRKEPDTRRPYRNGNVMYEVGIALACRQPDEVLLIRDDKDELLFDVSTIPHARIDFTNVDAARQFLRAKLQDRLREREYLNDARVQLAIKSLSGQEAKALRQLADAKRALSWPSRGGVDIFGLGVTAVPRLLDKQLIVCVDLSDTGDPNYVLTPLGRTVATWVKDHSSAPHTTKTDE